MSTELHVDLDEDPPTAGAAVPIVVVERPAHEAAKRALHLRMPGQRRRRRDDLSGKDFGANVVGKVQQISIGGELGRARADTPGLQLAAATWRVERARRVGAL